MTVEAIETRVQYVLYVAHFAERWWYNVSTVWLSSFGAKMYLSKAKIPQSRKKSTNPVSQGVYNLLTPKKGAIWGSVR